MEERRGNKRQSLTLNIIAKRLLPTGRYAVMEFISRDISGSGMYIYTEDVSIFDLGEGIDLLLDDNGAKYCEGKAKVVRSAKVFTGEGAPTESGFGLMFLNPDKEFQAILTKKLNGTV